MSDAPIGTIGYVKELAKMAAELWKCGDKTACLDLIFQSPPILPLEVYRLLEGRDRDTFFWAILENSQHLWFLYESEELDDQPE